MDALELAIPTAVAVPKLLASECFAGARVAVSDSQACESDGVSVFGGSKIEKCSAFNCHRAKMKNNLNSKRGDRRNSKVHLKAKCNAFSLKAGLGFFNAAVGMNNAFGTQLP